MEELINIYDSLSNHGVPSIVCNVVILIGSLIFYNLKLLPIISKYFYGRTLVNQSKINVQIKQSLSEYRELMLADRVSVYEFHNNIHNLSGKSFVKFTCNYETTRIGVDHYNLRMRDVQLSAHKEILDLVINRKDLKVRKSELANYSSELNQAFNDGGITNLVLVPMTNKGYLIGYITVEFTRDIELTDEQFDDIIRKTHELSGQISSKVEHGK